MLSLVSVIIAGRSFALLPTAKPTAEGDPAAKPRHGATPRQRKISPFPKWSKIEIEFTGPRSKGAADPNPFAIPFDAIFTSPKGNKHVVPGFYDGNGKGKLNGDVWKVRFSADETGRWTFCTRSPAKRLNGQTGSFVVTAVPKGAKGFWKYGRLQAIGTAKNRIRYLKFRDGPYWLKAGCDDPENFLGNYRNYNSTAKRIAAVDYLARKGINSLYILTHNIGGDDCDVWPWLGKTAGEAKRNSGKNARFDISKLEQWRELFEHMQDIGVVPYLILEDDSAWKRYDHRRYYRELIARFGYLPALLFNFGEEHNENYRLPQALAYMKILKEIDTYDHPRGIHNVNNPNGQYVDSPYVDFTSIQTGNAGRPKEGNALGHNKLTLEWLRLCRRRGKRTLTVNFDEGRPEQNRLAWWSVYLAGGVWEAHVGKPYDRPMSAWEPIWTELGGARTFMESIPFWRMKPRNDLVKSGWAFCLARPGEVYALYLPKGGKVTIDLAAGKSYDVNWWDPANGENGRFQDKTTIPGGRQTLTPPRPGDWAARIVDKEAR